MWSGQSRFEAVRSMTLIEEHARLLRSEVEAGDLSPSDFLVALQAFTRCLESAVMAAEWDCP